MLEESWLAGPQIALQTLEAFTDNAIARPLVLESLIQNMNKIYAEDFVHILRELAEYYMAPEHIQRVRYHMPITFKSNANMLITLF